MAKWAGVKDTEFFLANQIEQTLPFFLGDHELDLDTAASRQFEEMIFMQGMASSETMQGMASSETANRPKRRTAPDSELIASLEQPLPEPNAVKFLPFADIESQK